MHRARGLAVVVVLLVALAGCSGGAPAGPLTFIVAADMREFVGPSEFRGAVNAMRTAGAGSFMVSPGDIDPPGPVYDVVRSVLGSSYPWYPVIGNHEAETPEDVAWLQAFNAGGTSVPRVVNPGPPGCQETTYSFDWGPAHLVVIDEYYRDAGPIGTTGYLSAAVLAWLDADLASSAQPLKLVFGHEPGWPQPDADPPHRLRHLGESLDRTPANRDALWTVLVTRGARAYVCGHTHDYSIIMVDGVWQIDVGHARGTADTGAPSTFLRMMVDDAGALTYETWRLDLVSGRYAAADHGAL